jgi:hypothetical protein
LAHQLEHTVPISRSLAGPQFQAQGGDMAALLALQTAQRGQCVGEAAFLVGHLGVEHQGRCLGTRIVGPRMLQPVALLFRLAHALGGTRCNQG